MAKNNKENNNKNYFKEMHKELKKVVWPTPKRLVADTSSTIAFVLILAIIVFILDLCFDSINRYGIIKLQEKVQTSFSSEKNTTSEENSIDTNNVSEESQETNNIEIEAEANTTNNSVAE